MKKTASIAAMGIIAALTLAGCGDRASDTSTATTDTSSSATTTPSEETSSAAPSTDNSAFKACMVSDSGGFDDKSFNQTSHDGLVNAAADLGVSTAEVESSSDAEYADNINEMVKAGCNSITTVGFLLGDATEAAAKKNKDIDFGIVDYGYDKPPANLKGLVFDTGQPSYLAGYLAASQSQSGIVGTFGGLNIPTVTIFMTGFLEGVKKFNDDNGADVKVLGWNGKDGSFTEDFEDKTKGQTVAEQMIQQGADIIFPVAGPAGLGGLQAAKDAGAHAIWVDTDGCVSAAEYCDILLSSVMKGMDVAVEQSIKDSLEGSFSSDVFLGTLENGGVGLAPYHDMDSAIDQTVKDKIEELKAQIISGDIKVG